MRGVDSTVSVFGELRGFVLIGAAAFAAASFGLFAFRVTHDEKVWLLDVVKREKTTGRGRGVK